MEYEPILDQLRGECQITDDPQTNVESINIIIVIICSSTARVVGVPQMISQPPLFLHFPLFSTALRDLANSRPVHSLVMSSHLFLCLPCLLPPFTVPCKMVLVESFVCKKKKNVRSPTTTRPLSAGSGLIGAKSGGIHNNRGNNGGLGWGGGVSTEVSMRQWV